jgi:hypothetical protein
VTWTQVGTTTTVDMPPVIYVGLAVTSHTTSQLATASFTNVALNAPPALFVTSSTTLTAADAKIKKRLETLGYAVTVKAASTSATADATGKDVVVISSSVVSGDVNTKFKNVAVPVVTWENAIYDDMGMTGTVSGTDFGTTANTTDVGIYSTACDRNNMYPSAVGYGDGCHDRTAGLSGTVPALQRSDGPSCLLLSRQALPHAGDGQDRAALIARGAYVLRDERQARVVLIATGSEVQLALAAAQRLADEGIAARVVSAPCLEAFERQDEAYRRSVIPRALPRLAIEAGCSGLWWKYVGEDGDVVALERFGESAPAPWLFEHFGFTPQAVAARARRLLG